MSLINTFSSSVFFFKLLSEYAKKSLQFPHSFSTVIIKTILSLFICMHHKVFSKKTTDETKNHHHRKSTLPT